MIDYYSELFVKCKQFITKSLKSFDVSVENFFYIAYNRVSFVRTILAGQFN